MTTKKVINNNEYVFINTSRSNRSGFVHESKLYRNNHLMIETKCQYYNRTWECYTYQSVMKKAVGMLIDEFYVSYKNAYKEGYNIKRLTESKKSIMVADMNNNAYYKELKNLYELL